MIVDLELYAINREFIQRWYRNNNGKMPIKDVISLWSVVLHTRCIVLAFYLCESVGYIPELTSIIDSQIKFYGYKKILNQKSDSPYLTLDPRYEIKE